METIYECYYRNKRIVDKEMKREYPLWKLIFKGKEQFNRTMKKMEKERRNLGDKRK